MSTKPQQDFESWIIGTPEEHSNVLSASRKDAKRRFFSVRWANDVPCPALHIKTGLVTVPKLRRLICEIFSNQKILKLLNQATKSSFEILALFFSRGRDFRNFTRGFRLTKSGNHLFPGLLSWKGVMDKKSQYDG